MRIIAGEFGGRPLRVGRGRRVRPTSDRVREAWFSILGERVRNALVLDLFAGSGALGLEALSRGARRVGFVERGRPALAALRANVAALEVADRAKIHAVDALRFAGQLSAGAYDIAVADPPYDTDAAARLVRLFRATPFASILSIEHGTRVDVDGDERRRYGDATLTFCYAP